MIQKYHHDNLQESFLILDLITSTHLYRALLEDMNIFRNSFAMVQTSYINLKNYRHIYYIEVINLTIRKGVHSFR